MSNFGMLIVALVLGGGSEKPLTTSKDGGYRVYWPGTPNEEVRKDRTSRGEFVTHTSHLDRNDGQLSITYSDVSTADIKTLDFNKLLDATVASFSAQPGIAVEASRNITLGSIPGREIDFNLRKGSLPSSKGKVRIYLHKGRTYQVYVVGTKLVDTEEAAEFFKSFAILDPESTEPMKDWKIVTNAAGVFSIKMPPDPRETTQQVDTDDGPRTYTVLQATENEITFMVTSIPTPARSARQVNATLDATRDTITKGTKAKRLREKTLLIAGKSGRELKGDIEMHSTPKGGFLHCQIVIVNGRVYQLMAIGRRELAADPSIAAFLQSFKPTGTP